MKNKKLIIKKLNTIFFNLFKLKPKELPKASVHTCSNWDSLNHVKLITQIEKKFKLKISVQRFLSMKSYKTILEFLTYSKK